MLENIYYATGAVFFSLSVLILLVVLVYCVKILQKIVAIESEIKNTVTEAKNKVAAFSIGMASVIAILEKLAQMKDRMKKNDAAPAEDFENESADESPKKGPKKIAIR